MCAAKYKCYKCSFGCFRSFTPDFSRAFSFGNRQTSSHDITLHSHFFFILSPFRSLSHVTLLYILYTYNIYTIYIYSILSHSLSLSSSLIYTHRLTRERARTLIHPFTIFIDALHIMAQNEEWACMEILVYFIGYKQLLPLYLFFRYLILTLSLSVSRTHAQSSIFPCTRRRSCALMNYYL